jgi:hypothetical protein
MRRSRRGGLRRASVAVGVLALLALVVAACGGGDDGGDEDLDAIDAVALLGRAAERMQRVESFRFRLTHENGATVITRGLEMERAEGEVAGVDRLRAEIRASVGPLAVDIEIRILGDEGWITNPLTGRWEREDLSLDSFFDPARGVTALIRAASEPRVAGLDSIAGVAVYRVEARVDSGDLELLAPGATPGRLLEAEAWVGVDDPIVYRVEVRGAAAPAEDEDLVRRLDLFDIDEPITIEAPR